MKCLLSIYIKSVFIEQMKIINIGKTAYHQFKIMHSFWIHWVGGWGGGGAAKVNNKSLYAYVLQHFAML